MKKHSCHCTVKDPSYKPYAGHIGKEGVYNYSSGTNIFNKDSDGKDAAKTKEEPCRTWATVKIRRNPDEATGATDTSNDLSIPVKAEQTVNKNSTGSVRKRNNEGRRYCCQT